MLLRELRIFLTALMFFTRIPVGAWIRDPQEFLNQTPRYLPCIGWIVGAVGALTVWLGGLVWTPPLAILTSMTITILLTGAFHEDGFIDVCDGFGGGWTKDDILRIMKDSRVGAFGILGIGLLLAVKFFSLLALPVSLLPFVLITGHSLSRFASASLLHTHIYVREDASSKSKAAAQPLGVTGLMFAGFFGIVPLLILAGIIHSSHLQGQGFRILLWSLGIVWFLRWRLGRYFQHKIGGYTGDCLGAVQQVTEAGFYLTLAALL